MDPVPDPLLLRKSGSAGNRTRDLCICSQNSELEKKWEYNEAVQQLFKDFKRACGSVRREVLYNILNECGIPMKLVKLIKMRLNETYSRVRKTLV